MTKTLNEILEIFGICTVMNVCVYKIKGSYQYGRKTLTVNDLQHMEKCYLDTLKISNIKETGPKKTFKFGAINFPGIRHGKTVNIEMQDALGRLSTLKNFFGLKQTERYLYSNNSFAEPIAITGEMSVLDLQGNKTTVYLFIPCMIPKSNLNIIQDADGEFGVFDLSGELFPCTIYRAGDEKAHIEYYSISTYPAEHDLVLIEHLDRVVIYSALEEQEEAARSYDYPELYSEEFVYIYSKLMEDNNTPNAKLNLVTSEDSVIIIPNYD